MLQRETLVFGSFDSSLRVWQPRGADYSDHGNPAEDVLSFFDTQMADLGDTEEEEEEEEEEA